MPDVLWDDGTNAWGSWNTATCASTGNYFTATVTCTSASTADGVWVSWNTPTANYGFAPQEAPGTPEAEARADALLRSFLTPEQEQSWDTDHHFDVMVEGGDRPARHYQIRRGVSGNIRRLEAGRVVESLCVHPTKVPAPDVHLAQMLHLLHDEEGLRARANITRHAA